MGKHMASQKAVLARIHQAAIQLFAEHGLSHVNVRELAMRFFPLLIAEIVYSALN